MTRVCASLTQEQGGEWREGPKRGRSHHRIILRSVKVDACYACGGSFLDQGEIEKILEHKEAGVLGRMMPTLFGSGGGPR